jgi:hypothetical protein
MRMLREMMRARDSLHNLPYDTPSAYSPSSLEAKATRFRNQLDLLDREMRDSPELRQVFQEHSILTGFTRAQQTIPDFPTEKYADRPAGEDIIQFLKRVWWQPYLYYGFADAADIKAVDKEAFKAIPWPKIRYKPRQNLDSYLNEHWRFLIEIDLATRVFINSHDEVLGTAIANRVKGGGHLELEPVTLYTLNSRALTAKVLPARHAARISTVRANRLRKAERAPRH